MKLSDLQKRILIETADVIVNRRADSDAVLYAIVPETVWLERVRRDE